MFPFHHSLMSSCSCQHLLIACNSSLRVTAGAVGLGPAPPAIGCTHRESPAGAGASLAPSPHLGLAALRRIPQTNRGAALVPSCPHWGSSAGGFVRGISSHLPVPGGSPGPGDAAEKGTRQRCQQGGRPCPCPQLLQDATPPEHHSFHS